LICALEVEADAVHAVFDRFWEEEGRAYGQMTGDHNTYTTGVIGEHNVVLAYMPGMGKVNAATVVASMRHSFPGVELAFVGGICGGVPFSADKQTEIYLGDLIISTALVQYDFGRQYPAIFERKDTLEDNFGRPSQRLRTWLNKLKTQRYREKLQQDIMTSLWEVQQKVHETTYPGLQKDRLYESSYLHNHHHSLNGVVCVICRDDGTEICQNAIKSTCDQLRCEEAKLVPRLRSPDRAFEEHRPAIHFGRMGTGDTVMKSGFRRDEIAHRDNIIAFEMEGAGAWDHFPSLVVKGVSDYADSHKNKGWQGHAAAVAAAGMKALLRQWIHEMSEMPIRELSTPDTSPQPARERTAQQSSYTEYFLFNALTAKPQHLNRGRQYSWSNLTLAAWNIYEDIYNSMQKASDDGRVESKSPLYVSEHMHSRSY
jgi:nucleoside phosphorylase